MDLNLVFRQNDHILEVVFIILLLMSLSSWWLIFYRLWQNWQRRRENQRLQAAIWAAPDLSAALTQAKSTPAPIGRIAIAGAKSWQHYHQTQHHHLGEHCGLDEFLVRNLRHALNQEMMHLEFGLTWLASVGALAPFIGLFGTVWGIYHALINIAAQGQVNISQITAPIGEALIATAAGLAAAIPAVMAYNALSRRNRLDGQILDDFTHDFHAQLLTTTHIDWTDTPRHTLEQEHTHGLRTL